MARNLSGGQVGTPKSGSGRDVDVSQQLADRLARLRVSRATEALRRGWGELPAWLFCTRHGAIFPRAGDPAGLRAGAQGGEAPRSLHAAQPAPLLREPTAQRTG